MSTIVSETESENPLRPTIKGLEPVELEIDCSVERDQLGHSVVIRRNCDLYLAARKLDEYGEAEGGDVFIRLGIDGTVDHVLIDPTQVGMRESLLQARDAIAVCLDALDLLRKAPA